MASGDDAKREESGQSVPESRDQGESEFGPPVSEFGPPLDTFGPATFGPPPGEQGPMGWHPADAPERPAMGWQPADAPERPSLGWQPADTPERPAMGWQPADAPAAPPVPAPPQQYRAPDSTSAPDTVRGPAPERGGPAPETVRYQTPEPVRRQSPEPPRYPEQSADPDSQWHSAAAEYPSGPPRESSGSPARGPRSLWDDDDLAKKLSAPRPAPRESSGSLWDDDDLANQLSALTPAPAPESEKPRRRTGMLIGGAAAAVVVIVAIAAVIFFATRHKNGPENSASPVPAVPTTTAAAGALACQPSNDGTIIVGNGPGDTTSGPGAIFGFQHAYYSDRNADLAHTFVAPDANVQPAPDLQKTINDHIPQGTAYCLRIVTVAPDRFNVEITERHPDGSPALYLQVITTVNLDGRTLIQLIASY